MGQNNRNSTRILEGFAFTTTPITNYLSSRAAKRVSTRLTSTLEQSFQTSTLLGPAPHTHEARSAHALTPSALLESLVSLIQDVAEKLPSCPTQMSGRRAGTLNGMPLFEVRPDDVLVIDSIPLIFDAPLSIHCTIGDRSSTVNVATKFSRQTPFWQKP